MSMSRVLEEHFDLRFLTARLPTAFQVAEFRIAEGSTSCIPTAGWVRRSSDGLH